MDEIFPRSGSRRNSLQDQLDTSADPLITRQSMNTVRGSPAPIGEHKISPSQYPSSHSHINDLFSKGWSPFNNALQRTPSGNEQPSTQEEEAEDNFNLSSLARRGSEDSDSIFVLEPILSSASSSEPTSPRTLSPSNSFDQGGTELSTSNSFGEHPQGEHPSRTLFVRNINSNVDDGELSTLFEQYGSIKSVYTQCKHRGFVMITYYDIRHAKNAMRHLQGKVIRRRKLDIHYSIPKDNPSEKDINQGTIVVFNLDPLTSNEELKAIFGAHGEIKEVRETPNKKHHKFIEFYDSRHAENALRLLNKSEIRGKKIKIEPARPGVSRRNSTVENAEEDPTVPKDPLYSTSLSAFGSSYPAPSSTPSTQSYPPPPQPMLKYKPTMGPVGSVGSSVGTIGGPVGSHSPTPPRVGPDPFSGPSPLANLLGSPHQSHGNSLFFGSPDSSPFARSPASPSHSVWSVGSAETTSHSTLFSPSRSPFDSLKFPAHSYDPPSVAPTAIPKHFSRDRSSSDGSDDSHNPHTRTKRSDSSEDNSRFRLDLSKVGKEDARTTLMIKNIPNKYTQKMLLQAVDEKHRGSYDFFYLPIDFKNKCNVGYAFINFINYDSIKSFYLEFNGKKWEKFNSEKVCNIAFARIQGKNALIQHFQNSSLMCEDKKCRPIIFKSDGPNVGEQEPFPVGPNVRSRPAN